MYYFKNKLFIIYCSIAETSPNIEHNEKVNYEQITLFDDFKPKDTSIVDCDDALIRPGRLNTINYEQYFRKNIVNYIRRIIHIPKELIYMIISCFDSQELIDMCC